MEDLIYRQDAIAAMTYQQLVDNMDSVNDTMLHKTKRAAQRILASLPTAHPEQRWIPCSERLPSKEECKEWIDKHLGGIGYLYPCLVTRYSSINPDRTENNPYVAKYYYDGEDFVNNCDEVCSEYVIAWMPLPEPYREEGDELCG